MFSPGKINANCDKMKVAANTMMVIILQHINASNQDSAHLKLYNVMCSLYLKKLGGKSICFHNDTSNKYLYTSRNF